MKKNLLLLSLSTLLFTVKSSQKLEIQNSQSTRESKVFTAIENYLVKKNIHPNYVFFPNGSYALIENEKIITKSIKINENNENFIETKTLSTAQDKITSIALYKKHLVSGDTHSIKFWNLQTNLCEKVIEVELPVNCFLVLHNDYLAYANAKAVKVLNIITGKCEESYEMEFAPDCLIPDSQGDIIACSYKVDQKFSTIVLEDFRSKKTKERSKCSRSECDSCTIQ